MLTFFTVCGFETLTHGYVLQLTHLYAILGSMNHVYCAIQIAVTINLI